MARQLIFGGALVWRTQIYRSTLGPPLATLGLHSEIASPWASNDSIYIVRGDAGGRNVFEVDLDSLEERQVTHFTEATIFDLAVSPDLQQLAIARGYYTNELLLIELETKRGERGD